MADGVVGAAAARGVHATTTTSTPSPGAPFVDGNQDKDSIVSKSLRMLSSPLKKGGGNANANNSIIGGSRNGNRKSGPGPQHHQHQHGHGHVRSDTGSSMVVLTDDANAEDAAPKSNKSKGAALSNPSRSSGTNSATPPKKRQPHFAHRRDITPMNASSLTGVAIDLEDISTEPLAPTPTPTKISMPTTLPPPLPALTLSARKKSDNSTMASDGSTAPSAMAGGESEESPVRLETMPSKEHNSKSGPLSPIRSRLGMKPRDDSAFRRSANANASQDIDAFGGGFPSVQESNSFDSLLNRKRGGSRGSAARPRRSGSVRGLSRHRHPSSADDVSVSNLTLQSVITAASTETAKRSNKVKQVKSKRAGGTSASTSTSVSSPSAVANGGIAIAPRVQRIEENATASDGQQQQQQQQPQPQQQAQPQISRILRRTGTKIKRAVRRGVATGSISSRQSSEQQAPLRARLASDPIVSPTERSGGGARTRTRLANASERLLGRGNGGHGHGHRSSSTSPPCSPRSRRVGDGHNSSDARSRANTTTSRDKNMQDAAIRGRLDGLDSIELGPARYNTSTTRKEEDDDDDDKGSSAKLSVVHAPWVMVHEMLRVSGGKVPPEIVLEGFMPMGEDRWVVRLEAQDGNGNERDAGNANASAAEAPIHVTGEETSSTAAANNATCLESAGQSFGDAAMDCQEFMPCYDTAAEGQISPAEVSTKELGEKGKGVAPTHHLQQPQLQLTDGSEESLTDKSDADKGEGPVPDQHLLMAQMWGKDNPPPPDFVRRLDSRRRRSSNFGGGEEGSDDDEDDIMVAASCPVDVDEDIFIIDNPKHLQAVHDIAAAPLQCMRFDTALRVFDKILRSLQYRNQGGSSSQMRLVGTAHHNVGIIHMWTGQFEKARDSLEEAFNTRVSCLPENHPAIAVSICKLGVVQFALDQFDDAIDCFDRGLAIRRNMMDCNQLCLEMGKILNNIGCCFYQKGDSLEALKRFTSALDIQRIWLEGPIRREGVVYDTACTLSNMGKLYLERDEWDMSFYVYEEALLLQTSAFMKDHDIVLQTLGSLAFAKAKKGERVKALQIYSGILRTQSRKHGPSSRQAVEVEGLMGSMYVRQHSYGEALKCFENVLKWQTEHLPETHPSLRKTRETVEKLRKEFDGSFI